MKKAILLVFIFCSYIASAQVEPKDTDGNGYRNISTLEHLRWISECDSCGAWNLELDNDIDASDTKNWNIGDHDSNPLTPDSAMGWKPILTYGSFDGHGYKIIGLYINRPLQNSIGFFSTVIDGPIPAEIENLGLVDCKIIGDTTVGGLVGYSRSPIKNCYSSGIIKGTAYVGGLVGWENREMFNSYSTANVVGDDHVGGLIGENGDGDINNCFATGNVTGREYVGGLIGVLQSGEIRRCYAVGKVNGATYIGGLIGINQHSFNYVTKSIWNKETSGIDSSGGGKGMTTNEMKMKSTYTDEGWNFKSVWDINPKINNGYPIINLKFIPEMKGIEPEDTDSNGFYNLSYFSNLVWISINKKSFKWNFELDNDIKADSSYLINEDAGFGMIGDYFNHFTGIFDGKGYSIDSLYINQPIDYNLESDYPRGGMFQFISGKNSAVRNLKLTNCNFQGGIKVGGLVAECSDATIENCLVQGEIGACGIAGGMVGNLNHSTITNSSFIGKLNADNAGGLVAQSTTCLISKCFNCADINGFYDAGGLVGGDQSSKINDCYSIGNVSAYYNAGGLIGAIENTKIDNCYSVGNVKGDSLLGAFIGYKNTGVINNCFWDKDVCTIDSSAGGTPKTTSDMKTKSTFTNAGWDFANIWNIDGVTNQGYPFLQVSSVSVKDYTSFNDFTLSISPNPTSGKLNINYTLTEPANTSVSISNLLGIEIAKISENQFQMPASYNLNYDLGNLTSGVYFVTVKAGNKLETKKIIVNY